MTETPEEFMARFRATGLDMLTEARRREEAMLWPLRYSGTGRRRSERKNLAFCMHYAGQIPKDEMLDVDFSHLERRVAMTCTTPNGVNRFNGRLFQPDPAWYWIETDCGEIRRYETVEESPYRGLSSSFHRQASAAALAAATFREWEPPRFTTPSLGPDKNKEPQELGDRVINPKRLAKVRQKRKAAAKSAKRNRK